MNIVSVIYPREAGATFDYDYYERIHLPLVAQKWGNAGLLDAEALRGISGPDGGESPFFAIALLRFDSADSLQAALTGSSASEILDDISNFTSVKPRIQLNEKIGG